ncbi:hypothetical protein FF38_06223 [Lucilia cuprina]|uniref:Regulatory protein zeste n=1 Tax=Lucilia cuprina TaxID=7375 RepID=A0A0L0CCT0_LUCCU|nr:hypothetical protein FF38_06223 [Lucilia cuprina]
MSNIKTLGTPAREIEGWMKVWADMKTSVKQKLMHNKIESRATEGGNFNQKVLTQLEGSVARLLQMDTIRPEGQTFGISNIPTN